MSLINDALKKAERDRAAANATAKAEPVSPAPVAAAPSSAQPQSHVARGLPLQPMLLGGIVAVLAIAAGFFLLRGPSGSEPAKQQTAAVQPEPAKQIPAQPAVEPKQSSPVQVAQTQPLPEPAKPAITVATITPQVAPKAEEPKAESTQARPAPATTNPNATAFAVSSKPAPAVATSEPPPAVTKPAPAASVVIELPKPSEAPKPVASPAEPGKPSPRMIAIVDSFRVTGIRAAGPESKVLMNDRVYRLNDVVDHTLGIRLTQVSPKALTFTDEQGVYYTRNF